MADPASGRQTQLPGQVTLQKRYEQLIFSLPEERPQVVVAAEIAVRVPGRTLLPVRRLELECRIEPVEGARKHQSEGLNQGWEEYVDSAALHLPLVVRPRRPGERFSPLGAPGSKKISDFLTDAKVETRGAGAGSGAERSARTHLDHRAPDRRAGEAHFQNPPNPPLARTLFGRLNLHYMTCEPTSSPARAEPGLACLSMFFGKPRASLFGEPRASARADSRGSRYSPALSQRHTRRGSAPTTLLVVVFLVALGLRAGWGIYQLTRAEDPTVLEFPDEVQYWSMAQSLRAGEGLQDELGFRAARMPLYPGLLALFTQAKQGVVLREGAALGDRGAGCGCDRLAGGHYVRPPRGLARRVDAGV